MQEEAKAILMVTGVASQAALLVFVQENPVSTEYLRIYDFVSWTLMSHCFMVKHEAASSFPGITMFNITSQLCCVVTVIPGEGG